MSLRLEMLDLVAFVRGTTRALTGSEADPHGTVYHTAARTFQLYDEQGLAPVWLSRVVTGVQADLQEGVVTP